MSDPRPALSRGSLHRVLALLCAMVCAIQPLHAAEAETEANSAPPISPGFSYVADAVTVLDGGAERGGVVIGRADAWVDVDGGVVGLGALSAHIDLMAVHGPDLSGRWVGDAQGVSNIAAPPQHHLFEAWLRWRLSDSAAPLAITAKAGLIDLNSEFDVQAIGALFIHSSHGAGPELGQSGPNGPSVFPVAASGVVLTGATHGNAVLRLGVFDALAGSVDDANLPALRLPGTTGALVIGQVDVPLSRLGEGGGLHFGAWRYSRPQPRTDDETAAAWSQGVFALVEVSFAPKWHGWVRAGLADARTNAVAGYCGAGVVRDAGDWQLGLAMARAWLGAQTRRTLGARTAETALELTAARAVTRWMTIQPDLQYVIAPSWDPALRNALVAGLRLRLNWAR